MLRIDKTSLSERLIEKQKMKGTYDSPCMSICDYEGEFFECQTCGMRKKEKQRWKVAKPLEKDIILKEITLRME